MLGLGALAFVQQMPAIAGIPAAAGGFLAGWAIEPTKPFPFLHLVIASAMGLAAAYFAPSMLLAVAAGGAVGFGYSFIGTRFLKGQPESTQGEPNTTTADIKEKADVKTE